MRHIYLHSYLISAHKLICICEMYMAFEEHICFWQICGYSMEINVVVSCLLREGMMVLKGLFWTTLGGCRQLIELCSGDSLEIAGHSMVTLVGETVHGDLSSPGHRAL